LLYLIVCNKIFKLIINKKESEMANEIRIPVIISVQAKLEYYSGVVTFKQLIELFKFNEEDDDPTLKAQRKLNKKRPGEIAKYIISNPKTYVLPPVIATVGHDHEFEPIDDSSGLGLGYLVIHEGTHVYLCDGQHRREGIKEMVKLMGQNSELLYETIPVTFFVTEDVERERQIFGDINGFSKPIPTGLLDLYDSRSNTADVARKVMTSIPFINEKMEFQKSSLTKTAKEFFTFNTFHSSIKYLISGINPEFHEKYAIAYWEMLCFHIPLWLEVQQGAMKPSELRESTLCSHGVMIQALGLLGANIFRNCFVLNNNLSEDEKLEKVKGYVSQLAKVDFSKGNPHWAGILWDGGRVKTGGDNQKLAAVYLGIMVGLGLPDSDRKFCESKKATHLVALWKELYQTAPTTPPAKSPEPATPSPKADTGKKGSKKTKETPPAKPEPTAEAMAAEYIAKQSGIPKQNIVVHSITKPSQNWDIPPAMKTQTQQDLFILFMSSEFAQSDAVNKARTIFTAAKSIIGSEKNWRENDKKNLVISVIQNHLRDKDDLVEEVIKIIEASPEL